MQNTLYTCPFANFVDKMEKVLLEEAQGETTDWNSHRDLSSILQRRRRRRESALGCSSGYTE